MADKPLMRVWQKGMANSEVEDGSLINNASQPS